MNLSQASNKEKYLYNSKKNLNLDKIKVTQMLYNYFMLLNIYCFCVICETSNHVHFLTIYFKYYIFQIR